MFSDIFDIDIPTLRAALDAAEERYPAARLARNPVGNLAVIVDGEYAGWVDLATGEFNDLRASQ